ncbi:MAG: FapA family protein, partial [Deltaproteobacteria bacterium]|nr:FapA family protein [Deltaproteobacteria bacterium]
QEVPTYAEVIMVGKNSSQNGLSRVRATIYCARSGGPMDVPPIFKMGIVTAGQLHLSGPLDILGNLHANQGYSIEPFAVIEQLKQNHFSVTQSLDLMRPDYLSPLEVPMISEKKFQDYRSMAQQPANQILFGQQSLALSGDQKGLLIFVEGDLILTGNDLSGVTIVATGSITLNGSTSLNGNHDLDVAFIAGGDIGLNDFSQIAGVLWSNGTVKKTGSGKMMGTVVCGGNILQSGGLQFERVSQISNAFLSQTPTTYAFSLTGWSQM